MALLSRSLLGFYSVRICLSSTRLRHASRRFQNSITSRALSTHITPEKEDTSISGPEPTLVSLAEKANGLARKIQSRIPHPPTFQNDTLAELPAEVEDIRLALIDAANDLTMLARGAGGPFGRVQTIAAAYVCCYPSLTEHL
jgi:hypothetical protein